MGRSYSNSKTDGVDFMAEADLEAIEAGFTSLEAELDAHTGDTVDAHEGTAIGYTPSGGLAAIEVQAAIDELEAEKQPLNTTAADHIADTVDAHEGTAIGYTPSGDLAATEVQAAIDELEAEKVPTSDWASDTFTTASMSLNDEITTEITTNLGTDNIDFGGSVTGSVAPSFIDSAARTYTDYFVSIGTGYGGVNTPAAPSATGKVKIIVKNTSVSAQTITVRWWARKR